MIHRRLSAKRSVMSEINVVPYIDVMLVLLVIFMITAPLLSQGVKIDLPQAPAEAISQTEVEPLIVAVDQFGNYYMNVGEDEKTPITQTVLASRSIAILRQRPQTQVLVKGDDAANYGAVVEAMAILKAAGAKSVGLLTTPEEQ